MKTVSHIYKSFDELEHFIDDLSSITCSSVLLQLFSMDKKSQTLSKILKYVKKTLPFVQIVGCSSNESILDSRLLHGQTILNFTIFEKTDISLTYTNFKNNHIDVNELVTNLKDIDKTKAMLVFFDGYNEDVDLLLGHLDSLKDDMIVSGCSSCVSLEHKNSYLVVDDKILNDAIAIVQLKSEELIVKKHINFGLEGIGRELSVTDFKDNTIYSIEHKKTVDVYKKYLGLDLLEDDFHCNQILPIFKVTDGKKIAAIIEKINQDGSITYNRKFDKKDKVQFGFENVYSTIKCIEAMTKKLSKLPIETIFTYSFVSRKRLTRKKQLNELEQLSRFGTLVGCFASGVFYTTEKNNSHYYNEDISILTLCENKEIKPTKALYDRRNLSDPYVRTILSKSHLISQISKELNQTNTELKSELLKEYEESQEKDKHLHKQARYAQMGEMLSMIAHQWRQPINAISVAAIKLGLKCESESPCKQDIVDVSDFIQDQTQKMSQIINDFMNFFRQDKDKKYFSLLETIKDAISIVKPQFDNRGIQINMDISKNILTLGFQKEFLHAIINILVNARDAHERNLTKMDKKIDIIAHESETNIRILIKDNAGGIEQDILTRVFDPYFTTKEQGKGTGIGLYMTKQIIEKGFDSQVTAYNFEDGAVFEILIVKKDLDAQ